MNFEYFVSQVRRAIRVSHPSRVATFRERLRFKPTMVYERLSTDGSQGHISNDSQDDEAFASKRKVSISSATLIGLSSTTLISVLALLLMFLLQDNRQCIVRDNGRTFSARFVQNTSRMSLDHEYDYMWNDWLTKGLGIISTSETMGDKNDGSVGLSMYVLT